MPLVVLLAEDDLRARAEVTAHLWEAGCRVIEAADCRALRARIDEERADVLVISAEFGPCVAGDWLAELARDRRWRDVPAIAITARPDSLFTTALRTAGMQVLAKPLSAAAVRTALRRVGLDA